MAPATEARSSGRKSALASLITYIGRTGLEGRDGNPALGLAGHVDHRRRIGERPDLRQCLQPVLPRHVMVEDDGVVARLTRLADPFDAGLHHVHEIGPRARNPS